LIKCIKDIFPSLRLISFISLINKYGGTAITLIHYLFINTNIRTRYNK